MPIVLQALVMGVVQGLTEFLPISSSGHLILVPYLFDWTDPFIDSLAFSVMLHMGTLVALLIYFRRDWVALVPAFFAAVRERSFRDDGDRKLAVLLAITTIPAIIFGVLLNDYFEKAIRLPSIVALTLVIGAGIMWLADRTGAKDQGMDQLSPTRALVLGFAQSLALIPGISRSGISISTGLFLGMTRESAARFSFLMATPITAAAGAYETVKLIKGDSGVPVDLLPLAVGMIAALISGLAAIHFLLRYLRTRSLAIFVIYRLVLAAIVVVVLLGR